MTARVLIFASLLALLTGCASFGEQWKNFVDGGNSPAQNANQAPKPLTYSEQKNLEPNFYRQYHRTTNADLQNQAHLEPSAGSLWVMEGQGAYLFSQNVVRMIGDPIAVRLNGDPQAQLSAKAKVIAKLLAQLEARRRMMEGLRTPASQPAANAAAKAPQSAQQNPNATAAASNPNATAPAAFKVKLVPTRVVERLTDGDYRVRGMQPFLIGQREYKVIVSGIVRAEDFNDQGIDATKLLDSRFDIVSAKGAEMRE